MVEKSAPRVFISHASADKDWTNQFASALQERSVDIWYDEWNLRPGDKWQERMEEALRDSRIFCFVAGASDPKSPWTCFEIGAALADRKIIVPVLAGAATPSSLPPLLLRYRAIGEKTPNEAAASMAKLVEATSSEV